MGIFRSNQAALLYSSWSGSEGEYGRPNPLSLQVHCLLPDFSEADLIVSSLAYLLLVSPSNSSPTQLQHYRPKVPVTEAGTLIKSFSE